MPASATDLRKNLVQQLRESLKTIGDPVFGAFDSVPRHLFLPGVSTEEAYQDEAIVIKRDDQGRPISSSSQPAMMAIMLAQLGLAPGQRVLEIGAGTGYNAALIAHLVSPGGEVVSVDLDEDLVAGARENLVQAGCPEVSVVCADGAQGHPEGAPYDRIIATVGVWDLPPAWLDQLAPGGRLVVPLDLGGPQRSVAFEAADGYWASRSVVPCGFMRLRGGFAGPERTQVLDTASNLTIMLPRGGGPGRNAVLAALAEPAVRRPLAVTFHPTQLLGGLGLWLATQQPSWCVLTESETASDPRLPWSPILVQDQRMTAGLCGPDSLAVLGREEDLFVLGHGPGGAELADTLAGQIQAWHDAGQPGNQGLRIDAFPSSTPDADLAGRCVMDKTHTRLGLSWA